MTPRHIFFPQHGINVSFQLNKHVIHFQLNNGEGRPGREIRVKNVSEEVCAERRLSQPDEQELIWMVDGFLIGLEVFCLCFLFR